MKQPHLPALSLLKLSAVAGIILCHTALLPRFDACTRMVEILFILSGFLMAYNHYIPKNNKEHAKSHTSSEELSPTPACQYTKFSYQTRIKRFIPIHILCFLLQFVFVSAWAEKPLSYLSTAGVLNLTLQHAWFPKIQFSYNNVSWYLSALIFAYALTPLILKHIAAVSAKPHGVFVFFCSIFIIRCFLEYVSQTAYRYIPIDPHCNPLVQTLNYSLGCIMGVRYLHPTLLNQNLKTSLSAAYITLAQTLVIAFYLLCCVRLSDFPRPFFILLALPVVYILAVPRGLYNIIAKNRIIAFFSTLTLEIFMLHSFILHKLPVDPENLKTFFRFLIVTLLSALAYRLLAFGLKKLFSPR